MLVIDDLTVRIGGRALLEGASARIVPGARVGLVGRNGSGKTTLFNVIAGDMSPEHGSIELPPRWRIGRLAQEAPNGPESLLEVVLKADRERSARLTEAETAHDPHRIAEIQTRRADMGAHARPYRRAWSGFRRCDGDRARSPPRSAARCVRDPPSARPRAGSPDHSVLPAPAVRYASAAAARWSRARATCRPSTA